MATISDSQYTVESHVSGPAVSPNDRPTARRHDEGAAAATPSWRLNCCNPETHAQARTRGRHLS